MQLVCRSFFFFPYFAKNVCVTRQQLIFIATASYMCTTKQFNARFEFLALVKQLSLTGS